MKKIFTTILLLFTSLVYAQKGTPLFQVVTSDLTNQRAPILRELQDELDKLNNENITGVDLQILQDKIEEIKNGLSKYIQPLSFEIDASKYTLNYGKVLLISGTDETFNLSLDSLNKFLNKEIGKITSTIKSSTASQTKNTGLPNILFYISYEMLDKGNVTAVNYSSSIPYDVALTNFISDKIENEIKSYLLNYLTEDQLKKNAASLIKDNETKINDGLTKLYNTYNEWFIDLFDQANLFVKEKIEKPIGENLKGLTGLAIREGSGTFSGGILYSFRTKVNLSLSFYTNLNLNDGADSSIFSLVGTKISWAPSTWQFDGLFSSYWGNDNYKAFQLFEMGLSISNNFGGSVVLGLAAFYINNGSQSGNNFYSAGIYIKISDSAPALTIGATGNTGSNHLSPILQVNYPLNVSL
jgi:hypothetical protein